MLDCNDLLKAVRKAAVEAVQAGKPAEVVYGKVVTAEPLQIEIDQKIRLGANQLALGENMGEMKTEAELEIENLEFEMDLELDGKVFQAKAAGKGKMMGKLVVRRKLEEGEEVILTRMQGGQKYILSEKVKKNDT